MLSIRGCEDIIPAASGDIRSTHVGLCEAIKLPPRHGIALPQSVNVLQRLVQAFAEGLALGVENK